MDKKNLIFVLIVDLAVLVFSIFVFFDRYSKYLTKQKLMIEKAKYEELKEKKIEKQPEIEQPKPISESFRNILFQYRSSKARSVSIIGEFNDWIPQPLQKKDKNLWQITLKLKPGKYAYNYLVDGNIILDPNNLKKPVKIRDFESSYLIVNPREKKK